jgi:Putative restriction endonuclease
MAPRPTAATPALGAHRAEALRPKDPYEISDGHLIHCLPTGQRVSRSTVAGTFVIDSDPAVTSSGIDTGFSPRPSMLRAPDIAVGNIEDKPGWATAASVLAVEYADTGQDKPDLRKKISELLREGTRFVWVVRLTGPRRVEVHTSGGVQFKHPGERLEAPGILKNAVPVDAMYDRAEAHRLTLQNLLQREGFENLEAVKDAGREEGRAGIRRTLRRVLARRGLALSTEEDARIETCSDLARLERWVDQAVVAASIAEALR